MHTATHLSKLILDAIALSVYNNRKFRLMRRSYFPKLIEINHTKMKTNQTELKRKALAKTDWEEVL